MRRRLFTLAAGVSAVLCVVLTFIWYRSRDVAAKPARPTPEDVFQIKLVSIRWRFTVADTRDTVIINDVFGPRLASAFQHRRPPVFGTTTTTVATNRLGQPVDAIGEPVTVISVDIVELTNDSAVVNLVNFVGRLGSDGQEIRLVKRNGEWVVVSGRLNLIS